jgi:membrane protein
VTSLVTLDAILRGEMMGGAVLASIPPVVLSDLAPRRIVKDRLAGAVKGEPPVWCAFFRSRTPGRIRVVDVSKEWVRRVVRDDVSGLAAELAYWFFLSLFPFFIFLAALGGFVATILDVRDPTQQIVDLLGTTMPPDATRLVRPQIEHVVGTRNPGLLSLGILGAIWSATGWATATIKAMNRAYAVQETRPFWRRYLLAFGLMLLTGSVLVGAFVLFVAGRVFGQQIAAAVELEGAFRIVVDLARWPAAVILLLLGSASLYWAAPNRDLRLRWITPGAVLFAAGWLVATYLFTQYVAVFGSYNATYGTLGGVAVLLVWFYLTAFILLAGAELNAVIDEQSEVESLRELEHRDQPATHTGPDERQRNRVSAPPWR